MTGRRRALVGVLLSAVVADCASAPAPSASVPSSVSTPTAGPSGTSGSADPGRGTTLAARFIERIRDPAARYRLDQTLTIVVGEESSEAKSHSDVAGADMMVVSDSTVGGTTTHSEYLQADGAAYERTADDDWRATPTVEREEPFPFLQVSHLRHSGRELKGGALVESFSLAQAIPIGASVAESLGVMGGSASIVVFDCYLQADGSPVHVNVGFRLTAADGTDAGYGTIVQDYTEFGGDIVVDPPVG